MGYIQQGDILIKRIAKLPGGLKELKSNVVKEGEMTGHAHRLEENGNYFLYEEPKTKQKYLRVVSPLRIEHEEHKEIEIPIGDYVIDTVKEFDHFEEETRRVLD